MVGRGVEGFDEIEDFLDMAENLDAAPFAAQDAAAVDDEGAAFDAAHLFPIHVFHFHDREQVADGFIGIGTQFEGELLLGLEVLV